ncbi:MAG: cytochrome P450 [Pseudonocardiaceae bacterium]
MTLPPRADPTTAFQTQPLEFLATLHELHGDVFLTEIDGTPTVFCGGASGPRELFSAEREHLGIYNTNLVHDLFGAAIFNLRGAEHLAARKVLRSGLAKPRLLGYAPEAVRLARNHVAGWPPKPCDLYQAARSLTMSACTRIILGIPDNDPDERELRHLFETFIAGTCVPSDERYSRPEYWRARHAANSLRALFRRRINAVRTAPGKDFLSHVVSYIDRIAANRTGLPDHLLAVLVAMRETTASLVTWLCVELARDDRAAGAVTHDAASFLADPSMLVDWAAGPALRAALLEAERLHSPNTISLRIVLSDCRIGGYDVLRGWHAAYSPSANHLMPRLYDQPHRFCPTRFIDGSGDQAPQLLTFGRGIHACPGKQLAELLVMATASAVFAEHRLALIADVPTDLSYLPVKAPRTGIVVQLHRTSGRVA